MINEDGNVVLTPEQYTSLVNEIRALLVKVNNLTAQDNG